MLRLIWTVALAVLGSMLAQIFASETETDAEGEIEPHIVLSELQVRPKKVKYSKKNNPAVDFVERVMAARHLTDPKENNPYYSHTLYERINLGLLDFKMDSTRMFGFLNEYMDTSELSGRSVLNLSVKEKLSNRYFRRNPRTEREMVWAINRHGLDELAEDDESIQTALTDVMREVDVFDADINLLQNRFVSPLGRTATDFYKFFLTDTIADEERGDSLIVLSFVPHNPSMFGFTGRMYVVKDDPTMFIRRVTMTMPHRANVNYIERMLLVQEYDRAADGSRLKTSDELIAELNILSQRFYARRRSIFSGHQLTAPADSAILDDPRPVIYREDARARMDDADYWNELRPIEMQKGEASMGTMLNDLRSVPLYYWSEKVMKILVGGYVKVGGKDSKVDIGPILSAISSNGQEGLRLRGGAMTTARFNPRWFLSGYGAYGFKDHKWKYQGEVEYSFLDKRVHAREWPVRSLRLSHTFDVDQLGQHYFSAADDAFFLSFKWADNNKMTYRRKTDFEFNYEFYNNFSILARLRHERQIATPYVTLINGYGQNLGHYDQASLHVELRYAPGEKFFQSTTRRVSVNMDAPVFRLAHTFSPKGFLGSTFGVNKTEASVEKRWWFSAWGYLDTYLGAGHVWDRTAFPDLLIPNANLSYIIQPKSFALLNPMEFMNDTYAHAEFTYWANGAILNYVPLVRKLKLREVCGFRALWGHLSHRNDPAYNPELLQFPADLHTHRMERTKPYMEAWVGLDNIFRILRVDYVWRLSYRDAPGVKTRSGLRLGLHFSF